jgi:type VI secretion system protein ImpC
MSNTPQFSFELGTSPSAQRRSEQEPLRILFMTDLGEGCQSRTTPYASRPFRKMDIDTFEGFLEAERPILDVSDAQFSITQMDDFHPDHILKNVNALQDLLDLRQQLQTPATLEHAARKVRSMMAPKIDDGAAAQASDETDADTMSRLFGTDPNVASSASSQPTGSVLDQMIQKAVADHIVPDADPKAEPYIAAVEAAVTTHLRNVLHDPSFQSVEAAWRGLEMMVSQIETDETLSVHVWNISKPELIEAMGAPDGSPDASVLHKRLVAEKADTPFTLFVTDAAIGESIEDLRLLATLGAIAGRTNALTLAPITPPALGAVSWAALVENPAASEDGIAALRDTGLVDNIVGLGPRFLMRQPYGKRSDVIDAFAFEEVDPAQLGMGDFLWGAPSVIASILIARAFSQDGWNARINQHVAFDDLPLVYYDDAGEQAMLPCAELLLPDTSVEILLSTGLTPLVAVKNQNAVRLPHFQTLSRTKGTGQVGPFIA